MIIVLCNISHAKWWWGLMWPVFINAGWGLVCHFALPATPEAHARKRPPKKPRSLALRLNTVPEEPAKRGITIKEALQNRSPSVRLHEDDQLRAVLLVPTQRFTELEPDAVAAMASS